MIELEVPLGDRSYPVLVGAGARHRLLELLPVGVKRAAIVTQASIPVTVDPGVDHQVFTMGEGEHGKDLGTVEDLCRDWAQWGLNRGDCVVAVGGGVVTDTAGFAAAVYHRGIPVVHVATTLLAQIDAAIGGKTGVNLPEGKNLVGVVLAAVRRPVRHRGARHPSAPRVPQRPGRDGQVRLPRRRRPRRPAAR